MPAGSRIVSSTPAQMRRPANSQRHRLTHRDGNGEILFGALLEYHDLQTSITYQHAENQWKFPVPKFDEKILPKVIGKLRNKKPVSIVVLGDSISSGCNASGWAGGEPFQPAYPELLQQHLAAEYQTQVKLANPSVGGMSTPWALTMVDTVVKSKPDLLILAFGMNDSAGRSTKDYQAYTKQMIEKVRQELPDCEFILVATMLGNADWTVLKHERFPEYRDALAELCGPGVALADVTTMWTGILKHKTFIDITGNGVNHPNDFGHRVYAQTISGLLVEPKITK
ncbi:MAG: SGNH/GDSL hydrolase family protein [Planctomycetaceae bacterium]|nr:SGNH/GDSL hydrolase family protein [Planctomycetaceae bacterium]